MGNCSRVPASTAAGPSLPRNWQTFVKRAKRDPGQRNRVSRATIYREVADGRLRLMKIRNRTLIAADEEKRWLAEAMQSAS